MEEKHSYNQSSALSFEKGNEKQTSSKPCRELNRTSWNILWGVLTANSYSYRARNLLMTAYDARKIS